MEPSNTPVPPPAPSDASMEAARDYMIAEYARLNMDYIGVGPEDIHFAAVHFQRALDAAVQAERERITALCRPTMNGAFITTLARYGRAPGYDEYARHMEAAIRSGGAK